MVLSLKIEYHNKGCDEDGFIQAKHTESRGCWDPDSFRINTYHFRAGSAKGFLISAARECCVKAQGVMAPEGAVLKRVAI